MKLATMTVLSDAEINHIHEATLDILTNCGVKLGNREMLQFLKEKGLETNEETGIVRFTRASIEDALNAVPATFDLFNREGDYAFTLGDGVSKVAAGHNAVFWVDSDTGATRPSTVADVEYFARICESLSHIDMVGIPVMPQDIPNPHATLLYGVRACVENSRKPLFFSTDKFDVNHACIDLIRVAFKGDLATQAYGISQLSPTSPLYWEGSVLEAIVDTVKAGVPLAILPEPNAGVSCPFTLAGLLTMNNAECISGIAMIQMLKPGAKVVYANSWTTTDMRSGAALVGSCETSICRVAGAQLGRFYKIPSHTTAPNSDNHAHDEQNSWEKTFSQFLSIAAGNDLVVNCGMFATGMTCSHEQLVMDEEITAMSRRICQGIRVDDATIAVDLIKQTGPRGESYLLSDHTMEWLRSDEYFTPRVAVRGSRASWEAAGSKDTYALAKEAARQAAQCGTGAIDDTCRAKMAEIIESF
jgi:trimethylamine---corrinoid protein Co-methyltransferase